jgi:hypothetical protein
MSASPSSVLSLGLGGWSDENLLVRLGFGSAVVVPPPSNYGPTSVSGMHTATAISGAHGATHVRIP